MKTTINNLFLALFAILFMSNPAFSQRGSDGTGKTLYAATVAAKTKYPTTQTIYNMKPSTQKEARQRQIILDGRKLMDRILATGGRLTPRQKAQFEREFNLLESAIGQSQGASTCHGRCHDDFGDGFGGGAGWNRFLCKAACMSIGPVHGGN